MPCRCSTQLSYSPIEPAGNSDIPISCLIRAGVFTLDDLACVPPRTPSAPEEQLTEEREEIYQLSPRMSKKSVRNICILLARPDLPHQRVVDCDPVVALQLMRDHPLGEINCPDPANQVI